SLFTRGSSVLVSELKGKFASDYRAVRDLIYDAPTARGWFHGRRADRERTEWGIWTFFVLLGSALLMSWANALHRIDLLIWFLPFLIGGFVMGILVLWMPRRTAAGSAMLQRAQDFREFIHTAEARRTELVGQQDLFSELLPYAIAFGLEDRWARVFSELSSEALTHVARGIGFVGAVGLFTSASAFADAMSDFGSNVGGTLASPPASTGGSGFGGSGFGGGGGFSGGGVGGGGGGGW
ncbi:MAG TPA: hypothetical protein VGB96_09645, partial [Archangium sp.]